MLGCACVVVRLCVCGGQVVRVFVTGPVELCGLGYVDSYG